jgi:CHAT domain-containing protein
MMSAIPSPFTSPAATLILHVATHGFFLPEIETAHVGGETGAGDEPVALLGAVGRSGNPLLRSGLALAGANTFLSGGRPPPEAEDGILTAEDVTGLDLSGTELVVLSACETGLGKVRVGEGVFGLRRSFQAAGARALVMSLWKIPDTPTRELMEAFYANLLRGESKLDALDRARRSVRDRHPLPRDWCGFVCEGDPGPLVTRLSAGAARVRPGG